MCFLRRNIVIGMVKTVIAQSVKENVTWFGDRNKIKIIQ